MSCRRERGIKRKTPEEMCLSVIGKADLEILVKRKFDTIGIFDCFFSLTLVIHYMIVCVVINRLNVPILHSLQLKRTSTHCYQFKVAYVNFCHSFIL